MKIDLTYALTKKKIEEWASNISDRDKALASTGHLGTHFDVMGKEFPLDFTESRGVVFDVSNVGEGEVDVSDIDLDKIQADDFVLLHTGVADKYDWGSEDYNTHFPQLSWNLIEALTDKKIRMIGIDMRGIRKGDEHTKADNFCAQRGVFVVENLVNLGKLFEESKDKDLIIHIYPVNIRGFSGLPSRVVAEF